MILGTIARTKTVEIVVQGEFSSNSAWCSFPSCFSLSFCPLLYFTKLLEFSRVSQLHLETEHAPWQYGHPCGRVKAFTGREPRTWVLCALCKCSGQWAPEVPILYGAAPLFLTGHWIKIAVAAVCYIDRACLSWFCASHMNLCDVTTCGFVLPNWWDTHQVRF